MRRLQASFIHCLVAPLLLATAGLSRADHFVIGVEDVDYAPIMSTADKGEFRGYVRELLDLFARRHGHRFDYLPLPTKRLTAEHVAGRLDAVFPDSETWEADTKRGRTLVYSEPAVPFQDVVMVPLAKRDQPVRSLGIVRGYTPKRFLPLIEAGSLTVTEAGDPSRLMRMALADRVDGVQLALPVALYQLEQLGRPDALVPSTALRPMPYAYHYRLSSVRHDGLIAQFNRFLRDEQAAIAALQRRYGLDAKVTPAPR
ncbi:ABC-type amino acid transport substrate-binding protein [Pelomonas saccharophila]|uniref:ABC-type amino acid transport substrate-binding protein n=1 Tax=Roseateles saccharophilus TaxID=304 RepID=A0ABU1YTG9_ROSSA|nr:transporter substrate-binding domain-containing protein [Roseateles saccharophilus]MDR7272155.1 ABC-type amino acid transport substrate-binding protein [Roseateles saccharophilus]